MTHHPIFRTVAIAALAMAAWASNVDCALAWENWPQFRGPTGQGHSGAEQLPTRWDRETNIAWKQPIDGEGWSSPVVVDGRIYLTTAVPVEGESGDYSLRAICLNGTDGKEIWNAEIFRQRGDTSPGIHSKNSHASPTPIIDQGELFVHFGHQGTACLKLDGTVKWKSNEISYRPVHGNGGSPALVGDLLVFSTDGAREQKLNALHRETGKLVWQTRRGIERPKKFAFCTPLVIEVDGKKQIISPGAGMVGAYNPDDGKEIWRVEYDGYSVVPRPVYGHGLIYISTGFDSPSALAIRPTGTGNVTETHVSWTLKRGAPHSPSMLLVGDELFLVSDRGVASCVDAKSGELHWQERFGGKFSASPIYAGGNIYFLDEEGKCTMMAAAKQPRQLTTSELKERTLASPAVIDNALLIRTERSLYRIETTR